MRFRLGGKVLHADMIISNGRTDVECKIKEALNIKSINPTLNQNLFQHGSSFLINVFK